MRSVADNREVDKPDSGVAAGSRLNCYHDPAGRFTILTPTGLNVRRVLEMDSYSAASAFVSGQFTIEGDIFEAVRFFIAHQGRTIRFWWHSLIAHFGRECADFFQNGKINQRNIRFHYDRSNQFYSQFLDSRMQYSAADFSDPGRSLEDAQIEKLDQICRLLKLHPEERFLDVGCGWGGLLIHAAERFGVNAVGCTLSRSQWEFGVNLVKQRRLEGQITIELRNYREISGHFDKIASVGMFEHVGQKHLPEYFARIHAVLNQDGIFLNRGIVRPEGVSDGPETLFLQRNVFPGGELEHLSEVVGGAGKAGFEIQHLGDLRRDYALTCRAWITRLQRNAHACLSLVSERTYRTWLLYLAASSICFEQAATDAVQIVFRKSPCYAAG